MFLRKKTPEWIIHTYGSPILRKKSKPVKEINDEIRGLGQRMLESLSLFEGIGLAAPQVGVNLRIVAFDIPAISRPGAEPASSPGEMLLLPRMPFVLVNPEITAFGEFIGSSDEGCLSIPELYAPVERPLTITVKGKILNGENIECECGGLLARCIQHELDHLNGKLFVDRLTPEVLASIEPRLLRIEKTGRKRNYIKTR